MPLLEGMEAPLFELPDADMAMFSLAELRGSKIVVLFFYPGDHTPGGAMEAEEFSMLEEEFAKLGAVVVGVSRDECLSHAEFRDRHGLSVRLLSDIEGQVCEAYGVLRDHDALGRPLRVVQRSTFVIDKRGLLRLARYGVHAHGHPREVLESIKEMK